MDCYLCFPADMEPCREFWSRFRVPGSCYKSRASTAINTTRSLISAPSLRVYYFVSLTLSVCLSICPFVRLSQTLLLLFCFSMESSHFLAVRTKTSKLFSSIFTVRRSALHGLCDRNSVHPSVRLSVCLSVCLSHSWTVSTWFDLRS